MYGLLFALLVGAPAILAIPVGEEQERGSWPGNYYPDLYEPSVYPDCYDCEESYCDQPPCVYPPHPPPPSCGGRFGLPCGPPFSGSEFESRSESESEGDSDAEPREKCPEDPPCTVIVAAATETDTVTVETERGIAKRTITSTETETTTTTTTTTSYQAVITDSTSITLTTYISCFSSPTTYTATAPTTVQQDRRHKRETITCHCDRVTKGTTTTTVTVTDGAQAQAQANFAQATTTEYVTETDTATSTVIGGSTTTTTTETYSLATPTANGLKWYYWSNNFNYQTYPIYDPGMYAADDFQQSGLLQDFGWFSGSSTDFFIQGYGANGGFYDGEGQTLLAHGFLLAPETGEYTISTNGALDDEMYMWFGTKAYGGQPFERDEADFHVVKPDGESAPDTSYRISAAAGEVIPLAILYLNGQGPGSSQFAVQMPDGSQSENTTGLFIQHCRQSVFVHPNGDANGGLPAPTTPQQDGVEED